MKQYILSILLTVGLLQSLSAAVLIQSFSNNAVGTLNNGDSVTLNTNPNFNASDIGSATQLEIVLTLIGDAHMFIQNTTNFGGNINAEMLTTLSFDHVNTGSALFNGLMTVEVFSLDESPVVNGNSGGDSSILYDNPLTYTLTWTTTDQAQISSINGSSHDFQALPSHVLGSDSAFSQDVLGSAAYSNLRLDDVSYSVAYNLTTVPEPSSCMLLSGSLLLALLRRKR